MEKIAVCPGSFDPITNGHLDIIRRAAKQFDRLHIAILINSRKQPLFSLEERLSLIKRVTEDLDNVHVDYFEGLLVSYAKSVGATSIIRGLRSVTDYEYEMQIAQMNRSLDKEIETCFLLTDSQYAFVSSSIVKEGARHQADISQLVPGPVEAALKDKFSTHTS